MKTKKSFLQKTIITTLVTLLLINFIMPNVYPMMYYVEAANDVIEVQDGKATKTNEMDNDILQILVDKDVSNSVDEAKAKDEITEILGEDLKYYELELGDVTVKEGEIVKIGTYQYEVAKVDSSGRVLAHELSALEGSQIQTGFGVDQQARITVFNKLELDNIRLQFHGNLFESDSASAVEQEYLNSGKTINHSQNTSQDWNSGITMSDIEDDQTDLGGVLLSPIVDFLASIGDLVINMLQWAMKGYNPGVQSPLFSLNAFLVNSSVYKTRKDTDEKYEPLKDTSNVSSKARVTVDVDEFDKGWLNTKNDYYIPIATYSPEEIFAGKVAMLDINYINPDSNKYNNVQSVTERLHSQIASWYVALRNLAIVGLLSVLVYVGIRIILSSTAGDKAKYKQMLVDWLIALCLLFFLHYIMSFTITITQSICDAIAGGNSDSTVLNSVVVETEGEDAVEPFSTNLLGLARFQIQYEKLGQKIGFLIMYLALVVYTVIFTIFYLKRTITIAFLTLVAPLVALTYPIDKLNDGKAQAFDSWLKEYAYNVLIQPFHLIIYYVFIKSAMEFITGTASGIVYMIAVLAFILPAEKILRSFFGFDKARGTLGALKTLGLASMAGKLLGGGSKGGNGKGGAAVSGAEQPIRFQSTSKLDDIAMPSGDNLSAAGAGLSAGAGAAGLAIGAATAVANGVKKGAGAVANAAIAGTEMMAEAPEQVSDNASLNAADAQKTASGIIINPNSVDNLKALSGQAATTPTNSQVYPTQNSKANAQWARNLWNYHTFGLADRAKSGAVKGIKGAAKFATRTAFKAGAGTLAGAVALASGGGEAGALAAYSVASSLGGRGANTVINAAGNVERIPANLRNEIDIMNGNNDMKKEAELKEFLKNNDNLKYVRDMMLKEPEYKGKVPSMKEVRERMNSYAPYFKNGVKNIKEATKAHDVARSMSISDEQAAKMIVVARDRNIDASILNKESDRRQYEKNIEEELRNTHTAEQAKRIREHMFRFYDKLNGVGH